MKPLYVLATALLALTLSAEEPKPQQIRAEVEVQSDQLIIDSLQTEIATLKKQLATSRADLKVLTLRFQYEMQICESPDLAQAKVEAAQARQAEAKAKPKGPTTK